MYNKKTKDNTMIDKLTTFSAVIFVMSMIGATGAIETDQYLLGATMTLIGVITGLTTISLSNK
jgi:hypothetical protein|tara:strand:+ start:199 stop:387 length:189 start_codon:yes stop_codon:yes gene_type:complete